MCTPFSRHMRPTGPFRRLFGGTRRPLLTVKSVSSPVPVASLTRPTVSRSACPVDCLPCGHLRRPASRTTQVCRWCLSAWGRRSCRPLQRCRDDRLLRGSATDLVIPVVAALDVLLADGLGELACLETRIRRHVITDVPGPVRPSGARSPLPACRRPCLPWIDSLSKKAG